MAKTPYNIVNPKFGEDGKEDQIQETGIEKEEAQLRDLRNQLETLSNVRVKSSDLKSNWKYEDEELKSEVAIGYENGQSNKVKMSMSEQVDSYNQQLEEAAAATNDVNSKLPNNYKLDAAQIQSYKIENATPMEVTKRAAKKEYEEYLQAEEIDIANNYDELLQKVR